MNEKEIRELRSILKSRSTDELVILSRLANEIIVSRPKILIHTSETTQEECQFCKRFDELNCVCFDYPDDAFDEARHKCGIKG